MGLVGQFALLPFVFFLSFYGDPYPISRVGVASQAGQLQIVNAVCPGERLRGMGARLEPNPEFAPSPWLWWVTGDAAVPTSVPIGGDVPGTRTVIPLEHQFAAADTLEVMVVTSELETPYPFDVKVADVPASGVVSFNGEFRTYDGFHADVLKGAPCGDAYRKEEQARVFAPIIWGQLVAFLIGLPLAFVPRYRRPTGRPFG